MPKPKETVQKSATETRESDQKVQSFEEYLGLTPRKEEEEEDPEGSPHAYGLYRTPAGGPGVEIFLHDGTVHALPYHQIMESVTNPEASLLVIHCNAGHLFAVQGRNLAPLRTALLRHRAAFLKAPATGPDKTAIESITIERPGPEG